MLQTITGAVLEERRTGMIKAVIRGPAKTRDRAKERLAGGGGEG